MHITKRDLFQLNWLYSDLKIWKKCRSLDFNSAWNRLPCCLRKDLPKPDLLDIRLTTSFAVCNFGDTQALGVIFFWKCWKFNLDFRKTEKNREKVFCFWDNCIWNDCLKGSLFRREYLSLAVIVLTNSPKILHITKRDFFQLICNHSDQQIW